MKIAAICAFPVSSNPGMLSVDLALESLRSRLAGNVEIDRFCAWRGFNKRGKITLTYDEYHSVDQLDAYDKVIFWGDFLHWRGYAVKDFLNRGRRKKDDCSDQDIIDQWYSLYLLEGREDLQNRSIVAGGSFYAMSSEDLQDSRYHRALCDLYSNTSMSLMRDLMSANYISQFTGSDRSNFGCDCAALLEIDYLFDSHQQSVEPYIAYSLGRSGHASEIRGFVDQISAILGCRAIDINWLSKGTGIDETITKIQLINDAKAVITDIYHCAITAWRQKTPVICIGQGANRAATTLSDKKKEIFHAQIFSLQNYFYLEDILQQPLDKLAQMACYQLQDAGANSFGSAMLHQQKSRVLSKLIATITS